MFNEPATDRHLIQSLAKLVGIVALIILSGIVGLTIYGRCFWIPWNYPYGHSHSCDKMLYQTLYNYAVANGGKFPAGEASPEASLSLLSRPPWNLDAEILRGKTVPEDVVGPILKRGELLSPETCGWHYVEGLHIDDDQHIALFWDKIGLGHNGERLPQGGHWVIEVKGSARYIPADQWDQFLNEQAELLKGLEDRINDEQADAKAQ